MYIIHCCTYVLHNVVSRPFSEMVFSRKEYQQKYNRVTCVIIGILEHFIKDNHSHTFSERGRRVKYYYTYFFFHEIKNEHFWDTLYDKIKIFTE